MLRNSLQIRFTSSFGAFFCLFESLYFILCCYNDKEWIVPCCVFSLLILKAYKPLFSCFGDQGRCRLYIKSSIWHNVFIILATFWDPKKFCQNYAESGAEWQKCPKLSTWAKNGCPWENNILTVTVLLTLRCKLQMSKGVMSWPVEKIFQIINFG